MDALERDLKKEASGKKSSTQAFSDPALSFKYDSTQSLLDQLSSILECIPRPAAAIADASTSTSVMNINLDATIMRDIPPMPQYHHHPLPPLHPPQPPPPPLSPMQNTLPPNYQVMTEHVQYDYIPQSSASVPMDSDFPLDYLQHEYHALGPAYDHQQPQQISYYESPSMESVVQNDMVKLEPAVQSEPLYSREVGVFNAPVIKSEPERRPSPFTRNPLRVTTTKNKISKPPSAPLSSFPLTPKFQYLQLSENRVNHNANDRPFVIPTPSESGSSELSDERYLRKFPMLHHHHQQQQQLQHLQLQQLQHQYAANDDSDRSSSSNNSMVFHHINQPDFIESAPSSLNSSSENLLVHGYEVYSGPPVSAVNGGVLDVDHWGY